jgi:hypothetical protein
VVGAKAADVSKFKRRCTVAKLSDKETARVNELSSKQDHLRTPAEKKELADLIKKRDS